MKSLRVRGKIRRCERGFEFTGFGLQFSLLVLIQHGRCEVIARGGTGGRQLFFQGCWEHPATTHETEQSNQGQHGYGTEYRFGIRHRVISLFGSLGYTYTQWMGGCVWGGSLRASGKILEGAGAYGESGWLIEQHEFLQQRL